MSEAADLIRRARPDYRPKVAVILGSGLSGLAEEVTEPMAFSYAALSGFPEIGVEGHAGQLVTGRIGSTLVAVLRGRAHYSERGDVGVMKPAIRALKSLGCDTLIATNAAGSLDPKMDAGSVMMINDHINLVQASPLIGEKGNDRFVDMVGAYDSALRREASAVAARLGIALHEGVYVWFSGPQFETPAEVRMAARIGGTAVGMSTVPEVILARHAGMRVAGFSIITNLGAGMSEASLSHEHTMGNAAEAAGKLRRLLVALIEGLGS